MKIVFFSCNSNTHNPQTYLIKTLPSWQTKWNDFKSKYPEHEFITISQLPALFMPENTIICDKDDSKEFALKIASYNPDLVIPLSFWTDLFDWLPVKDSLIALELRKMNIPCIANSVDTSMICFNKAETQNFFNANNFLQPKSLYVNHDLFFCGGNRKEIKYNVYKEAILSQISNLNFPLIIKDPVSLSSYGMTVVNTKGEAINYLYSKKNSSDRLIQEFIDGENIGVEVYGAFSYENGKEEYHCHVLPPFTFSTNQYGITSPKLSLKYGPVILNEKLQGKLEETINKLANKLKLQGAAQIDLILKNEEFYIIEINPRLSGMTTCCCESAEKNLYELIFELLIEKKSYNKKIYKPVINMKLPLMEYSDLEKLKELPFICFINQINNLEAKQEREKGYCEIIISGKGNEELKSNLNLLHEKFPLFVDKELIIKAQTLINKWAK